MARFIDPDRIASGELDQDEIIYLQTRGQLPPHIRPLTFSDNGWAVEVGPPQDVWEIIKTLPVEAVEDLLARRIQLREDETPKIQNTGGIVGDGSDPLERVVVVEAYEEGWNNDSRRAELASRGLSVNGRKDDLADRLRRSDTGNLTAEDYGQAAEEDDEDDTEDGE